MQICSLFEDIHKASCIRGVPRSMICPYHDLTRRGEGAEMHPSSPELLRRIVGSTNISATVRAPL